MTTTDTTSISKPMRVGLVGTGNCAVRGHVRVVSPGAELVAPRFLDKATS